jgi:phosphate transport system substrate-binding protein
MTKISKYFDMTLLISSLIALLGLLVSVKAFSQNIIKIDGSSTVFPITEAMAEEFQKANKEAQVTVGISGTGGGFKKFCRGETDIADASRPISAGEMEACKTAGVKYLELPIGFEGMVVAVHPSNKLSSITVEELKKMWQPEAQGKVMKWNQVNPQWPDQDLKLFGAGSDSGTFDYFTEAIVGKVKASRGDYTASEDDNTLIQGISTDKNALGYIPMSYFEENKTKLKALGIVSGAKAPKKNHAVMPSRSTVENGTYFPLSRPLFIYVSEASVKKTDVRNFVDFYLGKARDLVPQAKYVALPQKVYDLGAEHLKKGKLGTAFGGHSNVGMKIEDIMKKDGKL